MVTIARSLDYPFILWGWLQLRSYIKAYLTFGYDKAYDLTWGCHLQILTWFMWYQITFNLLHKGNVLHYNIVMSIWRNIAIVCMYKVQPDHHSWFAITIFSSELCDVSVITYVMLIGIVWVVQNNIRDVTYRKCSH